MKKYFELKEKRDKLYNDLKLAEELLAEEASRLRKSVIVKKTNNGKTTILTNKNGESISFPTVSNSRMERKIYKFDGKRRGEMISSHERRGVNDLRLWLATTNSL